jgi:hypothetical protein
MFEVSEGQSAPSRTAAAPTCGGAGAAVFTYPCGFGGTAVASEGAPPTCSR